MNRRLLAGGAIVVWQEGDQTIIHHKNGLTLQLTTAEAQDLKTWFYEQDATWAERAEFESQQRMEKEMRVTREMLGELRDRR